MWVQTETALQYLSHGLLELIEEKEGQVSVVTPARTLTLAGSAAATHFPPWEDPESVRRFGAVAKAACYRDPAPWLPPLDDGQSPSRHNSFATVRRKPAVVLEQAHCSHSLTYLFKLWQRRKKNRKSERRGGALRFVEVLLT